MQAKAVVSILESASARIGEEIARVPKASGGDRKSKVPRVEHFKSGREATGIPRVSRSRYQKLASVEGDSRKASGKQPHTRKSRQGFPRRLVPLRFAWRYAASSWSRTPCLFLFGRTAFNEAAGSVANVSDQRSPIVMMCDWRRC